MASEGTGKMFTCVIVTIFVVVSCQPSEDVLTKEYIQFKQYLDDNNCVFPERSILSPSAVGLPALLHPCFTDIVDSSQRNVEEVAAFNFRRTFCVKFFEISRYMCKGVNGFWDGSAVDKIRFSLQNVCQTAVDLQFRFMTYNQTLCYQQCGEPNNQLSGICKYFVASVIIWQGMQSHASSSQTGHGAGAPEPTTGGSHVGSREPQRGLGETDPTGTGPAETDPTRTGPAETDLSGTGPIRTSAAPNASPASQIGAGLSGSNPNRPSPVASGKNETISDGFRPTEISSSGANQTRTGLAQSEQTGTGPETKTGVAQLGQSTPVGSSQNGSSPNGSVETRPGPIGSSQTGPNANGTSQTESGSVESSQTRPDSTQTGPGDFGSSQTGPIFDSSSQTGSNVGGSSQTGVNSDGRSQAGSSPTGSSAAGTSQTGPSPDNTIQTGPDHDGLNQTGPGLAESSQTGSGPAGTVQTGPGSDGSSQTGPDLAGSGQTGPGPEGSSQTGLGPAGSSQTGPGLDGSSQTGPGPDGSSQTGPGPDGSSQTSLAGSGQTGPIGSVQKGGSDFGSSQVGMGTDKGSSTGNKKTGDDYDDDDWGLGQSNYGTSSKQPSTEQEWPRKEESQPKGDGMNYVKQDSAYLEESPPSGHFMAYFLTAVVLCISAYIIYHNKQKILAFVLEGRREGQRRRVAAGGAKYSKLQPSVEEVMPSLEKSTTSKNYIY